MTPEDLGDAARLVGFALQPRLYAAQNSTYAELLVRYRTEPDFKARVHALVHGLGLVVVEDTPRALLLGSAPESVFAFKLSEYRKSATLEQRTVRGLILLGIAAFCYPTRRRLEDSQLPVFTARQVDDFLRAACEQLRQAAGGDVAIPENPDLVLAWQLYLKQPAVKAGARRTQSATVHLIEQTLEDMADWGLVREEPAIEKVRRFRALPRFRAQVRELGARYGLTELAAIRAELTGERA